jgi:hypothetical protein
MSAYMMVLAVAMLLRSGPAQMSDQIAPGLDLRGEWEGTWDSATDGPWRISVSITGLFPQPNASPVIPWEIQDEGGGRLRIKFRDTGDVYLGIYRQERKQTLICLGRVADGRPVSFGVSRKQDLLTLHSAWPRK